MKPFVKYRCPKSPQRPMSHQTRSAPIMEKGVVVTSFQEFATVYGSSSLCMEEGFALRELTPEVWPGVPESFVRLHSMLFVCEGSLTVRFGGKEHLLPRNGFSDIIDLVPLEIVGMSDDLRAFHLLCTETFLGNLIKNQPPFPFSYMLEMNESPVWVVNEAVRAVYLERLATIASVLRDASHRFRPDMLRNAFWMFLLDVANNYLQRAENRSGEQGPDRLRNLFLRFMHLLPKHVCEEHSVKFYASRLNITPQYLNRVVRQISGQPVSETINRMLSGEIIKLLDDTSLSIQQIADRLCFSDQATMSKFFKRQKGLSPTEYRRTLREGCGTATSA